MLKVNLALVIFVVHINIIGSERISIKYLGHDALGKRIFKDYNGEANVPDNRAISFIKACTEKRIVVCESAQLSKEYCKSMYIKYNEKVIPVVYKGCVILYFNHIKSAILVVHEQRII